MNIWDIAAGIISGICASMGLGGGGIMLLYLTVFSNYEQLRAQGINLIFFIPCAVVSIILHMKNKMIRWKYALPAALTGFAGVVGGSFLADLIGAEHLRIIFACFLLLLGLKEIFSKKREEDEEDKKDEDKKI